jgi:hypothetical protein
MLRSTSASVVDQLLMLIRMAGRPRHVVGPHQQVPSRCSVAIISCVARGSSQAVTTWLSRTSFSTGSPPAVSRDANRLARAT